MNQFFRDRILTLLHEHGLFDTLYETMRALAAETGIAGMLGTLFPERYVWFDTECVYEDDVFEELVGRFARATLGEWTPEHLCSTIEENMAKIDFEARGEPVQWTFEQASKWVSSDFTGAVHAFAEEHLSGAFVEMPVTDQCYHAVYLPRGVAAALEEVMKQIRQEWPSSEELISLLRQMLHERPWLWHVVRDEGNDFRFINTPTAQGELPLHGVVEAVARGDERALGVLKGLLRKGASPTRADGRGRTAFDVAAGSAVVVALLKEAVARHGQVEMSLGERWSFR